MRERRTTDNDGLSCKKVVRTISRVLSRVAISWDLAIVVVIGTAFGKITSFAGGRISLMPPIGLLLGRIISPTCSSISRQPYATLNAAQEAGAPTINYGLFLNSIFDFLIIALALYLLMKVFEKVRSEQPAATSTKPCPYCYTDIDIRATRCPHCTSDLGGGNLMHEQGMQ